MATPNACQGHFRENISYLEFHRRAELRVQMGEEQYQCPQCKSWFWFHEVGLCEI